MTDLPQGLVSALEGRYTLERQLGEGGMGSDTLAADDRRLWTRRADGTGQDELVYDGLRVAEGMWSPDGRWLLLRTAGATAESAQAERDLYALRAGEDGAPVPLVASPLFWEQGAAVSWDGRWLAYSSNETGRNEVFVRPFPDVEGGSGRSPPRAGSGPSGPTMAGGSSS